MSAASPATQNNSFVRITPVTLNSNDSSVVDGTPIAVGPNTNLLADTLGVSPLYRQKNSAHWQAAAQVFHDSPSHSFVGGLEDHSDDDNEQAISCHVAAKVHQPFVTAVDNNLTSSNLNSHHFFNDDNMPGQALSTNMIAPAADGDAEQSDELAIKATDALKDVNVSGSVKSISLSEMLPQTTELIFLNIKTIDDHEFTIELSMKGWRVASPHADSMNGDYRNLSLYTQYFATVNDVITHIQHQATLTSTR